MKRVLFALIAFSLLAGVCCQDENGIEKEKKAIRTVIEKEKNAYYYKDLEGLDASWNQESHARKLFMTSEGITELEGWPKIHQNNVEATERDWDDSTEPAEYSNFDITLYGNTALVLHDSDHRIMVQGEENLLHMRRILHLVKIEDEWKIDFMAMYFVPEAHPGIDMEM